MIVMILLILASPLSAALLFAVLAIARRPTSLLLLLLALLALLLLLLPSLALLLVELGIFPLVLDRGDAVGVFGAASIAAATKATLFLGSLQCFGVIQWFWLLGSGSQCKSGVNHLLRHYLN
jgi:hypothetical protein